MAAHSAQSLKDPECCSARGLNLWSPCLSGQTGTYPTELNWFLKDGSLRDHGLDGEVEDLDIGRLSKDVFFFTMHVHRKWEGLTSG